MKKKLLKPKQSPTKQRPGSRGPPARKRPSSQMSRESPVPPDDMYRLNVDQSPNVSQDDWRSDTVSEVDVRYPSGQSYTFSNDGNFSQRSFTGSNMGSRSGSSAGGSPDRSNDGSMSRSPRYRTTIMTETVLTIRPKKGGGGLETSWNANSVASSIGNRSELVDGPSVRTFIIPNQLIDDGEAGPPGSYQPSSHPYVDTAGSASYGDFQGGDFPGQLSANQNDDPSFDPSSQRHMYTANQGSFGQPSSQRYLETVEGYPPSQGYSSRTEEYLDDDDEDRPCTCDEEGVYYEGDFSQNLPCDCDDVTGDDSYDRMGEEWESYLRGQMGGEGGSSDMSRSRSPEGQDEEMFDYNYNSGSGTTCDNMLSETMGQMSDVGSFHQDPTVPHLVMDSRKSTPDLVSQPQIVEPEYPPGFSPGESHYTNEQSTPLDSQRTGPPSDTNTPMESLHTALLDPSSGGSNKESYHTAELQAASPSSEFEDATGNFDESMMENNQADTRGGNQLQPMSPVMHVRKQTDTTQIIQETGWQPATLLGHGINEPDPALRPPTPEDQGFSEDLDASTFLSTESNIPGQPPGQGQDDRYSWSQDASMRSSPGGGLQPPSTRYDNSFVSSGGATSDYPPESPIGGSPSRMSPSDYSQGGAHPLAQPAAYPPSPQPAAYPPSPQPAAYHSPQQDTHPSAQFATHPLAQPAAYPSPQPPAHHSAQPDTHPFAQPDTQPFAQQDTQPFAQPDTQPFAQPDTHPFAQPATHPLAQPAAPPPASPTEGAYNLPVATNVQGGGGSFSGHYREELVEQQRLATPEPSPRFSPSTGRSNVSSGLQSTTVPVPYMGSGSDVSGARREESTFSQSHVSSQGQLPSDDDMYNVQTQRIIKYEQFGDGGEVIPGSRQTTFMRTEEMVFLDEHGQETRQPVSPPYEKTFYGAVPPAEQSWPVPQLEHDVDNQQSSLPGFVHTPEDSRDISPGSGQHFTGSRDDDGGSGASGYFVKSNDSYDNYTKDGSNVKTASLDETPFSQGSQGPPNEAPGTSQPIQVANTSTDRNQVMSYDSPFATEDEGSQSPNKRDSVEKNPIVDYNDLKSNEELLTEVIMRTSITRDVVIDRMKEQVTDTGLPPVSHVSEESGTVPGSMPPGSVPGSTPRSGPGSGPGMGPESGSMPPGSVPESTPRSGPGMGPESGSMPGSMPPGSVPESTPRSGPATGPGTGPESQSIPGASTPIVSDTPRDGQLYNTADFQRDEPYIFMTVDDMEVCPVEMKAKRKLKTSNHLKCIERIIFHELIELDSCDLRGDAKLRSFVLGFIGHDNLKQALLSRGGIYGLMEFLDKDTVNQELVQSLQRAQQHAHHYSEHVQSYNDTLRKMSSQGTMGSSVAVHSQDSRGGDAASANQSNGMGPFWNPTRHGRTSSLKRGSTNTLQTRSQSSRNSAVNSKASTQNMPRTHHVQKSMPAASNPSMMSQSTARSQGWKVSDNNSNNKVKRSPYTQQLPRNQRAPPGRQSVPQRPAARGRGGYGPPRAPGSRSGSIAGSVARGRRKSSKTQNQQPQKRPQQSQQPPYQQQHIQQNQSAQRQNQRQSQQQNYQQQQMDRKDSRNSAYTKSSDARMSKKDLDTSLDIETPAGVSIDMNSFPEDTFDSGDNPVFLKFGKDEANKNLQSIQYMQKNYTKKSFQKQFLSPRSYMSEKFSEACSLQAVSDSFSISPRNQSPERYNSNQRQNSQQQQQHETQNQQDQNEDATLKFEAYKYFIRALFSRLFGPGSSETQQRFSRMWRSSMSGHERNTKRNKEETKRMIEHLLRIQIHREIYDVFWDSIGLSQDGRLDFATYLERVRDWGMLLAEDDQYRQMVNVLEKNLRNHRFYRSRQQQAEFSNSQISLEDVADFLGDLTGLTVTPGQVKQLLRESSYNKNYYTEREVISQLGQQFANVKSMNSRKELAV